MDRLHSTNEVGSGFRPFMGFPPVMVDVPTHIGPAGCSKGSALNTSYMSYSLNTNSITDAQSVSYSRDGNQANTNTTQPNNASLVQMNPPNRVDGGMFAHVPAPPTTMVRRAQDVRDTMAASTVHRPDNGLSFSASASYLPVASQQWNHLPPSSMDTKGPSACAAAPRLYAGVPPNGVLMRMVDTAGNTVWCLQPDKSPISGVPPPPPPPPPPVSLASPPRLSAIMESPWPPQPAQTSTGAPPPFEGSPLAWSLQGLPNGGVGVSNTSGAGGRVPSPDVPVGGRRETSSPPADSDTDDYEYEPYNANTLANRRVGSLDRVRCVVHGKERSAQNMVMMRHKTSGETFWRCKHSSQCKARPMDGDDTPLSSKESTLRSNAAEALLSPTSEPSPVAPMNRVPSHLMPGWSRYPPPPPRQYTLVSPTNVSLPLESSQHAMSPPVQAFRADFLPPNAQLVSLSSTFGQGAQAGPNSAYYPVFMADNVSQLSLPPPPPPPPLQQQQQPELPSGTVSLNGITYRLVHM